MANWRRSFYLTGGKMTRMIVGCVTVLSICFYGLGVELLIPTTAIAESYFPVFEKVIDKKEADHIFSLTRNEWEAYAKRIKRKEGWEKRLRSIDTGTCVEWFDHETGYGISIRPEYKDQNNPPESLEVGSYCPVRYMPKITYDLEEKLSNLIIEELGRKYSIMVYPSFWSRYAPAQSGGFILDIFVRSKGGHL